MDESESMYKIRSDCQDVATTTSSFPSLRRRRLSPRKWQAAFNSQGQLNFPKVLRSIERGGVYPGIRAQVWEFLLGCYSPSANTQERAAIRQSRREKYHKLKAECREMDAAVGSGIVVTSPRIKDERSPGTLDEISNGKGDSLSAKALQWKLTLHQIGLDVVRTDRVLEFYEDPKNLGKLWDILAVYAWIDDEVGYCQGMSDLCSPVVILFPDEADAFWCFKFLMSRVRENFRCTNNSMGVQKQLAFLGSAMKIIDPKLHKFLDELGGSSYIFAFRMLMVTFRREFSFTDILCLWEMFWAFEYHPELNLRSVEIEIVHVSTSSSMPDQRAGGMFAKRNIKYGNLNLFQENRSLAVFFVAGILEMLRTRLLRRTQGLDEVVKLLNDMTGKIDPHKACTRALKLHKVYLKKLKKLQ